MTNDEHPPYHPIPDNYVPSGLESTCPDCGGYAWPIPHGAPGGGDCVGLSDGHVYLNGGVHVNDHSLCDHPNGVCNCNCPEDDDYDCDPKSNGRVPRYTGEQINDLVGGMMDLLGY